MQPNNNAAYVALKKANDEFRIALGVAADSPLPSTAFNDIGRAMELQIRAIETIRPKTAGPAAAPIAIAPAL